jgi:hypothetical protein
MPAVCLFVPIVVGLLIDRLTGPIFQRGSSILHDFAWITVWGFVVELLSGVWVMLDVLVRCARNIRMCAPKAVIA